jgi:hypothetical protein
MADEERTLVKAEDLKPGDRFSSDRAEGVFVVESISGASAYRIVKTTADKTFGLPRELAVWLHPGDPGEDAG